MISQDVISFDGDYEIVNGSSGSVNPSASILELRMFDVGAGEAMLIIFPSSTTWLIDGGSTNGKKKNEETGATISKYLEDENLTLTRIIASHPHKDHVGAVEHLLKQDPPLGNKLRYYFTDDPPGQSAKKDWLNDLNDELDKKNAEKINLTESNKLINLPKGHAFLFAGKGQKEYTSIFMHLQFENATFLFTGDSHDEYEDNLMGIYNPTFFRADVLKITHHGSSSGTGSNFIKAVRPGIAIASTADDDGHELEDDVRCRLTEPACHNNNNCMILDTFEHGNIDIKTTGKTMKRNGRSGTLYQIMRDR